MHEMSYELSEDKIMKTIFYDDNFISMILMMDNLIKNFDNYKNVFYKFLTSPNDFSEKTNYFDIEKI
jgi:hypothetical protein